MSRNQHEAVAAPYAEQVAERYAAEAVPAVSEAGQRVLLDHVTRHLASAMHVLPVGDWADRVNTALDEWEDQARTTGPRVEAFEHAGGAIAVRMRDNI